MRTIQGTNPLKWVPFFKFFSTPLSINSITAFFIHECPYMEGAREFPRRSNVSSLSAIFLMFFKSSGLYIGALASLFSRETLLATRTVLQEKIAKFSFQPEVVKGLMCTMYKKLRQQSCKLPEHSIQAALAFSWNSFIYSYNSNTITWLATVN